MNLSVALLRGGPLALRRVDGVHEGASGREIVRRTSSPRRRRRGRERRLKLNKLIVGRPGP